MSAPLRLIILAAALAALHAEIPAALAEETLLVDIRVSPRQIVLDATRTGNWVTVHADLPFDDVDLAMPLRLNGVVVDRADSDDCGNLMVKVQLVKLRESLRESSQFTLEGHAMDGVRFRGQYTIIVKTTRREKKAPTRSSKRR